jgi:restriction endonuclease Mrr
VTERFAFKTKYFYDEANRDAFREQYEAMPFYEKAMENTPLTVGTVVLVIIVLLGLLASVGGV